MSRTTLGAPPGSQASSKEEKSFPKERLGIETPLDYTIFFGCPLVLSVKKNSSSYPEILTTYLINYSNLKSHQIYVCPIFLYLDQIQEMNNLAKHMETSQSNL